MSESKESDPARQELAGQQQIYSINPAEPMAYGRLCVLFAARSRNGADVCVKLFRDNPQTDDGEVDFNRELNIVRQLKHPSIANLGLRCWRDTGSAPISRIAFVFSRQSALTVA